ncbi:recombinase family protein [Phenylobacterium immobile]|uniref:recombinase family protein n=1 Tax=Phenylobacterium immobile TaxID=21 RepID=UPI000A797417|nr:recombinase family protein [Phenylobacterium immobile]
MLRIGYVRLRDAASAEDTATLKAAGCHVVRAEEPDGCQDETAALDSILDFIGEGDQLVVARLASLGRSAHAMLDVLRRLDSRGATVEALKEGVSNADAEGRAMLAVLQVLASAEPAFSARRRAPASEIRELQRAGVGPVEIARRLGVSRMTVWRKLRADA